MWRDESREEAMNPSVKRKFGRVDLDVTAFGFGTAPIGNFLKPISESESQAMIETAWRSCAPAIICAGSQGTNMSSPPKWGAS
jgi:hypothetical protein